MSNGRFEAIISETGEKTNSIFPTLYCAYIMSRYENVENSCLKRAQEYCLSYISPRQTWNYWERDSLEFHQKRHPDDVDDTTLALQLVHSGNEDCIAAEKKLPFEVESYSELLKSLDKGLGGPFNTWIVPKQGNTEHWDDIDPVVQAHIFSFAQRINVDTPGATTYIETCIEQGQMVSKYYDNETSVLYAFASVYNGSKIIKLNRLIHNKARILTRQTDTINVLDTARLLSSLIRTTSESYDNNWSWATHSNDCELIEDLYQRVIHNQRHWNIPYPFYIESIQDGNKQHVGSSAVTLTTVLESLELYESYRGTVIKVSTTSCMLQSAIDCILASPYITSQKIRAKIKELISNIMSKQGMTSIIVLPEQLQKSALPHISISDAALSHSLIIGIAGWTAWMHADTIRDKTDEKSPVGCAIDNLSIYTILHSIVHETLRKIDTTDEEYARIATLIGKMEQANYEETGETNVNNVFEADKESYNDSLSLRERTVAKSVGAAIPLLVLMMIGGASREDIEHCMSFFTHFLRARQLSDDAMDWKDDITNGRRTLVTQWIDDEVSTDADMYEKSEAFNGRVLFMIAREIHKNILIAQKSARKISCISNCGFLVGLLLPYVQMIDRILKKYERQQAFQSDF